MHRIVCAGHVNWDVTLQVESLPEPDGEAAIDTHRQAGGGSASNVAATLAGLECQPLLFGSVGDDEYGTFALQELRDAGVDVTHVQRVPDVGTTVKYLVVDADGQVMVLATDGANERFRAATLPGAALASATHLHLTGQAPETAAALAQRAVDRGLSVSVDPGRRLSERAFEDVLDVADVVFLNTREATALTDGSLGASAIRVITEGGGGARVERDDETVSHSGYESDALDTTGAGDAFAAGFLAAMLADCTMSTALAVGNACGAATAATVGGRSAVTWDDIAAYSGIDLREG